MDNIKLSEYLASEEDALTKLREQDSARAKKFKKRTILFVICFVAILGGAALATPLLQNNTYDNYMDMKDTDADQIVQITQEENLISDGSLFKKYEMACLGNTCNNHLNGGLIAESAYCYSTIAQGGAARLAGNFGTRSIPEKNVDCINLTKDKVYYRNKEDHKFYSRDYSMKGKPVLIIDKDCAQCLVYLDQYVYFLNYENNTSLDRLDLQSGKIETVVDNAVKGFAVIGDNYIYQDYFNTLRKCDLSGNVLNTIDNVDKFYINGNLIIQNNDKIIEVNLEEDTTQELIEGVDELLGADEEKIYFTQKGKAIARSLKDGSYETLAQGHDYYYGAFSANGKITIPGGELDEDQ